MDQKSDAMLTRTIGQAAQSILKQGYALYATDKETSKAIVHADLVTRCFFKQSNDKEGFQKIVDGHLQGYNVPSSAKELYRVLYGGKAASSLQQWPNQEMEEASNEVAGKLHELLYHFVQEINRQIEKQHEQQIIESEPQPARKRRRPCSEISVPQRLGQTNAMCPLDYFFYHGDEPTVNCSEHVDRGVLIGVCLDPNVVGLEVQPHGQKEFVCPEEIIKEEAAQPGKQVSVVCIMAGDQLKHAVSGIPAHGSLNACVHRVRQELGGERLSIAYELRC